MAVLSQARPALAPPGRSLLISFVLLALLSAAAIGVSTGLGVSRTYLIAGLIAPFVLLLTLVRPHWAVPLYVVLVYADLLSVLTRYHGLPAVARFTGAIVLTAAVGYRLIIRRNRLAADEMTWWLLAYGIVVALGLGYARDPALVQTNLIEFVRNVITYLVIINLVTKPSQLKRIVLAMLAMGVLLALITIYQSTMGDYSNDFGGLAQSRVSEITGDADAPRPSGTLGDANYYGQSLLILLPFAFYLIFEGRNVLARLAGAGAAACLLGAIVFTYSRGDALAVGAILAAAALYKKLNPAYLLIGLVAALIALPFVPSAYLNRLTTVFQTAQGNRQTIYNETSIRGRAGAQQAAIAMFLDYPLLGVGRENYPLHQLEYLAGTSLAYKARGIPPHNLYLEIAAEHGLLGLLVLAGLMVTAARAVIEARRRFFAAGDRQTGELVAWMGIGLFGYMVSSFFLHGAYLYMLWLQLALIIAARLIARALPARQF